MELVVAPCELLMTRQPESHQPPPVGGKKAVENEAIAKLAPHRLPLVPSSFLPSFVVLLHEELWMDERVSAFARMTPQITWIKMYR